jgi:hypothetical protein
LIKRSKASAKDAEAPASLECLFGLKEPPDVGTDASDLLRDAADALEEAYKGREDIPPASLALIVALRERVEHITAGKTVLDEAEPTEATVTQDEP